MSEHDDFQKWVNSHNPSTNHPLQDYEHVELQPDEITALLADIQVDPAQRKDLARAKHETALERILKHFVKLLFYLINNKRLTFGYLRELAMTDAIIGLYNAVIHAVTERIELSIKLVSKFVNEELAATKRCAGRFKHFTTAPETTSIVYHNGERLKPSAFAPNNEPLLDLSPEASDVAERLLSGDTRKELKVALGANKWNALCWEVAGAVK